MIVNNDLDGFPYHGDSDGAYAALPLDDVSIVLRLKDER